MDDLNCTDFSEKQLIPIVLKLSKDKISNVRLNCVIIIRKGIKYIKNKDILNESKSCSE